MIARAGYGDKAEFIDNFAMSFFEASAAKSSQR